MLYAHKKFFEIVCGFSIDKELLSVCCEGNMRWNKVKKRRCKEDNEHNVCFFRALLLCWKKRKQKQGGKEMIREAVRKMEKNTVTIIVEFLSGLSLLDLSIAFRHLKKIYLNNFWRQSLI